MQIYSHFCQVLSSVSPSDINAVIVRTAVKNAEHILEMSLSEFCDLCSTSESSVKRFVKSAGLSGFNEFAFLVHRESSMFLNGFFSRLALDANAANRTEDRKKYFLSLLQNDAQTKLDLLQKNFDILDRAAKKIAAAGHVMIFNNTPTPANFLLFALLLSRIPCHAYNLSHMKSDDIILDNTNFVLVYFLSDGSSKLLKQIYEKVREGGSRILLVTNKKSLIQKFPSDFSIEMRAPSSPLDFLNFHHIDLYLSELVREHIYFAQNS